MSAIDGSSANALVEISTNQQPKMNAKVAFAHREEVRLAVTGPLQLAITVASPTPRDVRSARHCPPRPTPLDRPLPAGLVEEGSAAEPRGERTSPRNGATGDSSPAHGEMEVFRCRRRAAR